MSDEFILADLNPPQREAVETLDGPLLILAGAGSGKTRVVTRRIANLIRHGVPPWAILAITFTNKAAGEMRRRVEDLTGPAGGVWISTFHSFCARILRRDGPEMGLSPDFTIYDEDDAKEILRKIVKDLDLDEKRHKPAAMKRVISDFKNRGLSPDDVPQNSLDNRILQKIYAIYAQALRRNQALDFDDLLLDAVRLFRGRPDVLERRRNRFAYILVDEYQDTNGCQYELVKLLGLPRGNVCVTGDPDQSIYAWRGADVRNILSFERDFPNARVVRLEQNYRSTPDILAVAQAVIQNNVERKEKGLWTDNVSGAKPRLLAVADEYEEAATVVRLVKEAAETGRRKFGDIAVFYRTNAQSRILETAFLESGVPYQLVGGTAFYERREVKDALAWLRLTVNSKDDGAFLRAVNAPRRGVGKASLDQLAQRAGENAVSLLEAAGNDAFLSAFRPAARKGLGQMAQRLASLRTMPAKPVSAVVRAAVETSGLLKDLLDSNEDDRVLNLEELVNAAAAYDAAQDELAGKSVKTDVAPDDPSAADAIADAARAGTVAGFLEQIALIADADHVSEDADRATLMTLHTAKGLEFPLVFIVGMEDGLLPLIRKGGQGGQFADPEKFTGEDLDAEELKRTEEERRLFYVGVTRAREELILLRTFVRRRYGFTEMAIPSRFLSEIPEELLDQAAKRRNKPQPADACAFTDSKVDEEAGFADERGASDFAQAEDDAFSAFEAEIRTGSALQAHQAEDDDFSQLEGPGYEVGDNVRHPKFGRGTVLEISGGGLNLKVLVRFSKVGAKLLQVRTAKLERIR